MKHASTVIVLCLLLSGFNSACNSSKFGGSKKSNSENKDSGDQTAQVLCMDDGEDCAALSCEELFALEDEGKINDDNRDSMESALSECRDTNRGSSDDQEPIHEGSEDDDQGSDDEDCE